MDVYENNRLLFYTLGPYGHYCTLTLISCSQIEVVPLYETRGL
jgi:hypothetical protein